MKKEAQSRLMKFLVQKRTNVIQLLFFLSGLPVPMFLSSLVSFLKNIIRQNFPLDIKPWASLFLHPRDPPLGNYVSVCLFTAGHGVLIYQKGLRSLVP
jgi:hypothetical protein